MASIISVKGLTKTYDTGVEALKPVDLEVEKGEILALAGCDRLTIAPKLLDELMASTDPVARRVQHAVDDVSRETTISPQTHPPAIFARLRVVTALAGCLIRLPPPAPMSPALR